MDKVLSRSQLVNWRTAVFTIFFVTGLGFASWASRIPQVRDGLQLNPQKLGLVLLSIAIGSLISMPLAGLVISRIGAARTVSVMSLIAATGLAMAAIGYRHGVAPVVPGLFLLGLGSGTWDVAMNVEGAEVERRIGRSIMSRFHAGFSVGTVAGALLGSAMIALGGSLSFAFLMLITRSLRTTPDIVLTTSQFGGTFLLGALMSPIGWVTPTAGSLALFAVAGVTSVIALLCINRSLKLAPASVVVPYQYSMIVWAVIFGFVVFGDVPSVSTLLGAAIIIGAGFTGCALAHDLALRGFGVTVVERGDICSGTSGRTHGLLHSGGRYCVGDHESAVECIEENGILRRIAAIGAKLRWRQYNSLCSGFHHPRRSPSPGTRPCGVRPLITSGRTWAS